MYQFYLLACVPIVLGLALKLFDRKINWWEWVSGSSCAIMIAAILHLCTIGSMTSDVQTLSGKCVQATYNPEWVETWQVAIYYTTHHSSGFGKNRRGWTERHFSHYETRYRTHYPCWEAFSFYGNEAETYSITKEDFDIIAKKMGGISTVYVNKSRFHSGDHNIYQTALNSSVLIPTITTKNFVNKVKAAPSAMSFKKVPENIPVKEYPNNSNHWRSDRLIGDAMGKFDINKFDAMNSRLGLSKKCNVIIVGFNSPDASFGEYQRNKWFGGKKNDIVICYGYVALEDNRPVIAWVKSFGWSENHEVFSNLEKIFLANQLNDDILPLVEKEIATNYVKYDWKKTDLLKVEPTKGWYWAFIIVMVLTQICLYVFFQCNDYDDGSGVNLSDKDIGFWKKYAPAVHSAKEETYKKWL